MAFCTSGLNFIIARYPVFQTGSIVKWRTIYRLLDFINAFPFVLKPIFGFISDVFPLYGYRFKSYIIGNLLVQFSCSLVLFLNKKPSLFTLLSLNAVLTMTAAFISCLLQGVITMVTKIDSKIRNPEFRKGSKTVESKSHLFIGIYQFLFLLSFYAFTMIVSFFDIDSFLSQKVVYPMTAAFSFVSGMMSMYIFKERKVNKKNWATKSDFNFFQQIYFFLLLITIDLPKLI